MRKLLLAAIAAALSVAGSAGAVINGEPDGTRHPYVVAVGFPQTGALCTGTLVSPTIVVTAGHCTYGATFGFVWSGPQISPRTSPFIPGQAITHPDFKPEITPPNTGDLGIVRLAAPIQLSEYAQLPKANYLENLPKPRGHELDVTFVGYGAQTLEAPVFGQKMAGTGRIKNLNNSVVRDYGVKISGVNGSGRAGLCLGDSGAPILHGSSNTILAVHSFGDVDTCEGATYSYRLDTAPARAFLGQFVTLP